MPWMISTEGFPLKKEIWSGSCLEGDSGAASVTKLLSPVPSTLPTSVFWSWSSLLCSSRPPVFTGEVQLFQSCLPQVCKETGMNRQSSCHIHTIVDSVILDGLQHDHMVIICADGKDKALLHASLPKYISCHGCFSSDVSEHKQTVTKHFCWAKCYNYLKLL